MEMADDDSMWMLALLLALHSKGVLKLEWLVYHRCRPEPVTRRAFNLGFQPTPWVCPHCRLNVHDRDSLTYALDCLGSAIRL